MRKNFVAVLTAMLFVVLCLAFAACSGELKHTHTPNTDDSDCTTAVTCSTCNEITTAARVHTPSENWSKDETSHWKVCTNEGCTVLVEKTNHTPNVDDGDCTTGITCSVCNEVTTEATTVHSLSESWNKDGSQHWKACTNEGCTVLVEKTNHTPNADDGDCTTAITCSVCQEVFTAKSHVPNANWGKDETNHWKTCTNIGCTKFAIAKTIHTPKKDDGDCTKAVTCVECNEVTTEATVLHALSENWDNDARQHWKVCTNDHCTKLAVGKTNHIPNADDENCTTAVICSICNAVTTAKKVHASSANWSEDDSQHWKECTNEGCTTFAVEKTNHIIESGSNTCECGNIIEVSIFTITDGNLSSCNPGAYTSITIPNEVTSIGSYAFQSCSGLTSIDIPSSVTTISNNAFEGCSGLASITIPASVTTISSYAFYNCSGLTSITIPASVTTISNNAFSGCSGLTSITLPFVGGSKDGTDNTHFGYIFGANSYSNNSSYVPTLLKTVVITGGTIVGSYAFEGCSELTSITIGSALTSIDGGAFRGCSALTTITVAEGNTKYHSAGNCVIETTTKTLILGCKNSSIPTNGSVTRIGEQAFADCKGLTSITIPNGVTDISSSAFYNCSGLTSITIPASVTSISDRAFEGCSRLSNITIPASVTAISSSAFSGCSGLTSITIPFVGGSKDGTDNTHFGYIFGANSYSNNSSYVPTSLKTVVITGGTIIDPYAFEGCRELTSITIPESIISISNNAFRNCSGLTSITIPKSVTTINNNAFYGCSGLTSITLPYVGGSKDGTVSTLFGYIFGASSHSNNANHVPASLKAVVITGGESIGDNAFRNCSGLTSIKMPESVTAISDSAFMNCSGLTSINIPKSVTAISDNAFSNCSGLTSIDIPSSVTVISYEAFSNCSGLTKITIGNGVTAISSYAFSNCSGLTSIEIPSSVTTIADRAFEGCSGLTNITIPSSVKSIASGVFNRCSSLAFITYNGTTEEWKEITKVFDWNTGSGDYTVTCTDGTLTKSQS